MSTRSDASTLASSPAAATGRSLAGTAPTSPGRATSTATTPPTTSQRHPAGLRSHQPMASTVRAGSRFRRLPSEVVHRSPAGP